MRGIPGSGKSTYLLDNYPRAVVVSVDQFFTRSGSYVFDPRLLGIAHKVCFQNYLLLLESGVSLIAVDNTNLPRSEVKKYRDAALVDEYQPFIITILEDPEEAYLAGIHNVPREKVYEMAEKLDRVELPGNWEHLIIDYT